MQHPDFQSRTPASPEIFSFREGSPLLDEQPSQPLSANDQDVAAEYAKSSHRGMCDRIAGRIPLAHVYGPRIKIGLSEPSSCFVVRSEHHFKKEERRRQSLRKHIFEQNHDESITPQILPTAEQELTAELFGALRGLNVIGLNRPKVEAFVRGLMKDSSDRPLIHLSKADFEMAFKQGLQRCVTSCNDQIADESCRFVLWPYAETILRYRDLKSTDCWGKYLGFIDLRTYSRRSPLALALLVPPRDMRHDPNVFIIAGEYGPLFGGPGFMSCVYNMHDPDETGAYCAQAAAINALVLLADRGVRLMGGYTLTYLGKTRLPLAQRGNDGQFFVQQFDGREKCLADMLERAGAFTTNPNAVDPGEAFKIDGFNFRELRDLFKKPDCRAAVDELVIPVNGNATQPADVNGMDYRRLALRYMEAYLTARCPIILFVDDVKWSKSVYFKENPKDKHAVVIVGMRRNCPGSTILAEPRQRLSPDDNQDIPDPLKARLEIGQLIVNDPGYQPFVKVEVEDVFAAGAAYSEIIGDVGKGHLHLLCVAPAKLKRTASECVKALNGANGEVLNRWHEVTASSNRNDFRIALVHRDDVIATFFDERACSGLRPGSSLPALRVQQLGRRIDSLANSWYWAIAGYTSWGYDGKNLFLTYLWLFDAEVDDTEIPAGSDPWQFSASSDRNGWQVDSSSAVAHRVAPKSNPANSSVTPREPPWTTPLRRSLMTSSSERPLANLLDEVFRVSGVDRFDLYMLRDIDRIDIVKSYPNRLMDVVESRDHEWSSTLLMAREENMELMKTWALDRFQAAGLMSRVNEPPVSALATYFPHISSFSCELRAVQWTDGKTTQAANKTLWELSSDALVNTMCLAIELAASNVMENAIVEIVCGTILDECSCEHCRGQRASTPPEHVIFRIPRAMKIETLCDRLLEVVTRVVQRKPNADQELKGKRWAFAVELEPGSTYVVNGDSAVEQLLTTANSRVSADGVRLRDHLGLNLDIAHAKIASLDAVDPIPRSLGESYRRFKDDIIHAHLADHPGMHTRDQAIGVWTPLERHDAGDYELLDLLGQIANDGNSERTLPFSHAVALELEGCNRMSWITRSLGSMQYMFDKVRNYRLS